MGEKELHTGGGMKRDVSERKRVLQKRMQDKNLIWGFEVVCATDYLINHSPS